MLDKNITVFSIDYLIIILILINYNPDHISIITIIKNTKIIKIIKIIQ
jgi:hypothetical protein